MKLLYTIIAATILTTNLVSCKKYSDEKPTISGIAVANADFSTLEDAAKLAV